MAVGAGAWAALAVLLTVGTTWALRGSTAWARQLRWALAIGLAGMSTFSALWFAGRMVRGFSRDYAVAQALFIVGVGLWGSWLMGSLLLQLRARKGAASPAPR